MLPEFNLINVLGILAKSKSSVLFWCDTSVSYVSSYNAINSASTLRLNIIHIDTATNSVCCVIINITVKTANEIHSTHRIFLKSTLLWIHITYCSSFESLITMASLSLCYTVYCENLSNIKIFNSSFMRHNMIMWSSE